MALFEQNEEDFCNYLSSINNKAEHFSKLTKGTKWSLLTPDAEQRDSASQEAQFEIQEAEQCVNAFLMGILA